MLLTFFIKPFFRRISASIIIVKSFDRLKAVGLISWRVSRVFNKVGAVKTNEVYIYKNQQAYLKGQKIIEKFLKDYESFYKNLTAKIEATRGIVLFEFK